MPSLRWRIPSLEFRSLRALHRHCRLPDILAGTTCPPISLRDFELFLSYQELSLENLQFVVWYLDYRDRFFKLPLEEQRKSPDPAVLAGSVSASSSSDAKLKDVANEKEVSHGISMRKSTSSGLGGRPRSIPTSLAILPSPPESAALRSPWSSAGSPRTPSTGSSTAPLLLAPSSSSASSYAMRPHVLPTVRPEDQPFRDETLRVVATFMRPGGYGKKELALDQDVRDEVMRGLVFTTHPDVFTRAYAKIYDQLELSAHNFVAYQSANINPPKQMYWYAVGITFTLISLLLAGILTHFVPAYRGPEGHHRPLYRAARLGALPFGVAGALQIYSAFRGFCSEVFGRGGMQLKPWELEDPDEAGVRLQPANSNPNHIKKKSGRRKVIAPFDEDDGDLEEGSTSRDHLPPAPALGEDSDAYPPTAHEHEIAFVKPQRSPFGPRYSRPPVFGPERVVLDPNVRRYHMDLLTDMAWFGFGYSIVFAAVVLSIPGPKK